jgi:Ni/Co efflux regulator RcnB
MRRIALHASSALAFLVAGLMTVAPALADNDRRGDSHDRRSKSSHDRDRHRGYFDDRRRVAVHDYYQDQFRHGRRCPPGLARTHDGCIAPAHARHWNVGRRLPREVVYYSVPPAVIVQIGQPPSGHRYVRVAGDILLIAVGTGRVVDAIQNLGRM